MSKQLLVAPMVLFQSGVFAPGAKVRFFLSGTTTAVTVYADADETTTLSQPVTADAAGVLPQIFSSNASDLKAVITASDDTAIETIDPIPKADSTGATASSVSLTPVTGNAATDVQTGIANNTAEINKTKGIGALAIYGLVAKTADATYAARGVIGGDGIDVTNGYGVSGNPTVAIHPATQAEAEAGTLDTVVMTPLKTAQAMRAFQTIAAEQATTSGTEFDFFGIPTGTTEISVFLDGVSLSGTDNLLIQIGDDGGMETSGYDSGFNDTGALVTSTAGFIVRAAAGASVVDGTITLRLANASTFKWLASGTARGAGGGLVGSASGIKSLSAELDRVRLTRTGTDTFDAGAVSISYR